MRWIATPFEPLYGGGGVQKLKSYKLLEASIKQGTKKIKGIKEKIPKSLLESLYDSVKAEPIKIPEGNDLLHKFIHFDSAVSQAKQVVQFKKSKCRWINRAYITYQRMSPLVRTEAMFKKKWITQINWYIGLFISNSQSLKNP